MSQNISGHNADPRIKLFRALMLVVIVGLVLSGATAFPLLWELERLNDILGEPSPSDSASPWNGLRHWIAVVHSGLQKTYAEYPWVAYGTDWLAFGHFVIALFFVEPLLWPCRDHRWALSCGLIACVGVIPLACIAGEVRGIPWGWRLIDCAFGVVGFLPLAWALVLNRRLINSKP